MVVVDHVRGGVRNRPVEQPVASSGHTQALSASLEREHFTSDDPCDRTPGAGEEENIDAHECYSGILCSSVDITCVDRCVGMHAYATNNELANAHANRTHQQEVASTQLLNEIQTWKGRCYVDRVCNDLNDEGVSESCVGEVLRAVINYRMSIVFYVDSVVYIHIKLTPVSCWRA